MKSQQLIDELIQKTNDHISQAENLSNETESLLNARLTPESWSALECLEHLNRYGDFYLPEITRRIESGIHTKAADEFKSGWLGNYFANSMIPDEKMKKMKTFKDKNPLGSKLNREVILEFIRQQKEMLILLEKARTVHLGKVKTSISISNWITLKLGDTFRFVIYHNWRHLVQAQRAISNARFNG